jgi:hypothetical protein
MLKRTVIAALVLVSSAFAFAPGAGALDSRNPFGKPDVVSPDGPDVTQLAARIQMPGGPDDRNAPQWAEEVSTGKPDTLDGVWFSRWESGTSGSATVRVVGDRFYALYTNQGGRMAGKTWIVEAVIGSDKRLAGRWVQIGNPRDAGPFIGLIVAPDRIDGIWSARMSDRWDFRRRLPASN